MSILLVLILLLGLSYAWFSLTLTGTKQNVIKVGKLSLILDDSMGEGIHLESAVPTYTNAALEAKPYTFTVTNDGTVDADYSLYLDNKGTLTNLTRMNYAIKKDGKILSINVLSKLTDSLLFQGTIHPGENSSYELYIWLDANTTMAQASSLTGTYESVIRLESSQAKERNLSQVIVKYDCNGKADCTNQADDVTYFQHGYYNDTATMKYIWYSGRMWVATSYDSEGNVKAVTPREQAYMPWGTNANYQGSYVEKWLNEKFLPSLNHYEKFLVINYAWNYSKETGTDISDPIGTDKIVRGPVGLLNKVDFYYGTSRNYPINSSAGLIQNIGEYYYMGTPLATEDEQVLVGGMGYLSSHGYRFQEDNYAHNINDFAGVLPSIVFQKDLVVTSGDGTAKNPYRLKGDESGKMGELLNTRYPGEYVAFGEGLNSSYRISEIEDGKVKLISTLALGIVDIDSKNRERWVFLNWYEYDEPVNGSYYRYPYRVGSGDLLHYDTNSTDYPIAYFLNHEFLNPINGYVTSNDVSMIATDQTFYTGTVTGKTSYTPARDSTKQVTATIGLPILGETFTIPQYEDQFYPKSYMSVDDDRTLYMTNNGSLLYEVFPMRNIACTDPENHSIRPSIYLKNTVKIKCGTGTKMDPYILTLN